MLSFTEAMFGPHVVVHLRSLDFFGPRFSIWCSSYATRTKSPFIPTMILAIAVLQYMIRRHSRATVAVVPVFSTDIVGDPKVVVDPLPGLAGGIGSPGPFGKVIPGNGVVLNHLESIYIPLRIVPYLQAWWKCHDCTSPPRQSEESGCRRAYPADFRDSCGRWDLNLYCKLLNLSGMNWQGKWDESDQLKDFSRWLKPSDQVAGPQRHLICFPYSNGDGTKSEN